MTRRVFVKRYDDPRRCLAARRHLAWLHDLDSGVRLPALQGAAPGQLVFEHLGPHQPGPEHLCEIAETLGRLHAAVYDQCLYVARLDHPFHAPDGLLIADFVRPRRRVLQNMSLGLEGQPAAFYKDANIRNFLLVDDDVAIVDFDDLTLAPFGYDLAKLVVSTAMTHGTLAETTIATALRAYNHHVSHLHPSARCSPAQFDAYAHIHDVLTRPYLGRNGYRHTWPHVRAASGMGGSTTRALAPVAESVSRPEARPAPAEVALG